MKYQHRFHVEDVTCEQCEARVRRALLALPGAQSVELVRTSQDEAAVFFTATEALGAEQIETAIARQSVGTTHHYRVRWETPKA